MENLKLSESLDFLGYSGMSVGTENSQLLKNSLLILQKENHFRKCYYWGRINGAFQDYYIASGFQKDCLNDRIFYYSIDCINWLLLPKANKPGLFLSPLAVNRFEGEPSVVTNVYDINPPFPPNQDLKQYYDGPLPKELKEEDRLAATIELIVKDAVVVPRGAWLKRPNGIIVENPGFEGLCSTDALNIKSYLHARVPQQEWNKNLLTRHDYDYAIDFLDPISSDVPKGCWSLQMTNCKQAILLHSFYWPGMVFYYKFNSPDYGFLYVGDGKKNMDVPFMV